MNGLIIRAFVPFRCGNGDPEWERLGAVRAEIDSSASHARHGEAGTAVGVPSAMRAA